jgi:beta-lactamase class A
MSTSSKNSGIKFYFMFAIAALVGVIIGYQSKIYLETDDKTDDFIESRSGGYRFINPLLECDNFKKSKLMPLVALEKDLNTYIEKVITEKKCSHVSVYFRDLNNGPWIGIGENKIYSPASLLKVPILIATMKKADSNRSFLDIMLPYDKRLDIDFTPNIKDSSLQIGKSYTVYDLARRMIKFSDNEAKALLFNFLEEDIFYQVSEDLGINYRGLNLDVNSITVKQYSSFFRILYNSTYLSRKMSEMSLKILSESSFNKGIEAGIPSNITVAHKFGERGFLDSNMKQLHDCGIVYYPNSPYLICIMTKGNDLDVLSTVISDISRMVYEKVDSKLIQ